MIADAPLVAAQLVWDLILLLVVAAFVPIIVYRAGRLIRAAKSIDILFATTLAAAGGVLENTKPTAPALDETIAVAGDILGTAGKLDEHSAAIENLLRQRAAVGPR